MLEVPHITAEKKKTNRVKEALFIAALSMGYMALFYWLVGYKSDQLVLTLGFCICYYLTPATRRFIIGYSVFIIYWVLFDSMKAYPNYLFNEVHIRDLYEAEKNWFGFLHEGILITPNEYFRLHAKSFLDALSGFFYLSWMPVPLGFGFYLFLHKKREFLHFSLAFFLVNLLGFIVYYLYPAAPPWYVQKFGFDLVMGTPGNTGELSRFDTMVHLPIFKSIYEKSSNVFAAMPSLHSAYPVIVFFYGVKNRLGKINLFLGTVMLGIWFAAVYTSHHYMLDVFFGIVCALTGILLLEKVILKNPAVKKALDRYQRAIS